MSTRTGSGRRSVAVGGSTGPSSSRSPVGELAIPLAAVAPTAALALGAFGLFADGTALWLAMAIGLVTLGVQGARYSALEGLGRLGTVESIGLNLAFGLVIVALKALVAH